MLYLYQSNRLEDLAGMLHAVHRAQPPAEPLAAEDILVQSQGMRRYLTRFLAGRDGIAANLNFLLPAKFHWHLMRQALPDLPALSPFAPGVMRWRLLKRFSDGLDGSGFSAARAALSGYLAGGSLAAYQLAGQLADIFDQYLVYRPEWLDAWQQNRTLNLGSDEIWQAELWRYLNEDSGSNLHRVGMWRALSAALSEPERTAVKLPPRLSVFGISVMAPVHLQLLQAVSQHTDVHIFALNPSEHYWGNIISPAQILQNGVSDGLEAAGHPLLASLGKQGRDFFDALSQAEPQLALAPYPDAPASDSLLHRLQYDIQTLQLPEPRHTPDNSIRIVSAHSPLRELQILKDHLLDLLEQHPDWQPHDIAVLTPDIEPYHPFIEAVFGQTAGGRALPYSVSDIKIRRRRPLFDALAQALAVLESRFEIDTVLQLLGHEAVLSRFGLTRQDLPLLHEAAAELNIRWGWDAQMRGGNGLYTWQQGLDSMTAGWLLPENGGLWQHTAAWHTGTGHLPVLSRFHQFARTLSRHYHLWQTPADTVGWIDRLRTLKNELFQPAESDQAAEIQLEEALADWQAEASLAGFSGTLPPETVLRHIGRFLDSESEAGFLRSGITICGMVPMRSLPFKAVCLLGLNDKTFPRNTKAAAFDLIAQHPRAGDRARRDDDRYLFLEALMSAREHLYLSYIGRSIRNNDELAPSPLVSELADTLDSMCGHSSGTWQKQLIEQHPLQPFSARYFQNGPLISSRSDYAQARQRPSETAPFFTPPENGEDAPSGKPPVIRQADLIEFWQNPPRYWLRHRLDWRAPWHGSDSEAAEPFEPPQADAVADAYTEARRRHLDFATAAEPLHARSQLPEAELGKLWQQQYEAQARRLDGRLLSAAPLPDTSYRLHIGGMILEGSLDSLTAEGRITTGRESTAHFIARLLQHLILNAVRPQNMAHFAGHHLTLGKETATFTALPDAGTAADLLVPWLDYYRQGQIRPLPFVPHTALKAAQAFIKPESKSGKTPEERLNAAAHQSYFGRNSGQTARADYPENATAFARRTPPPDDPLFARILHDTLIPALTACGGTDIQPSRPSE
ncbi:exodeoxyribonuclease V subunit gamma [Neisseria leonii]|uniref:exodeoxyribonuclease V subunit gamma n=1 Tax=Neisseria leonii TaxID=2995413 RepID=UPI00237A3C3E|nr:exodeoxyribonuclease V subunit gamma [Neisseria sp. 3986]MDD9324853.1 exodeoxyribonuclease V subunit gamma [Neisseria sp. 3986]